jgi:hypothetical protein
MIRVSRPFACPPRRLLLAILLLAAAPNADAQAPRTQWVPRGEMLVAIIGFAVAHCESLDGPLAVIFERYCKDPKTGFDGARRAGLDLVLALQSDEALHEICRRHGISGCRTQEEASRGQPILVLDRAVAESGRPMSSSWSPDNRYLLLKPGITMGPWMLDVASGQLVDKPVPKGSLAAWSPDGKLAALASMTGLHILAVGSWKEAGVKQATKEGCRFPHSGFKAAFTADSRSLWVLCSSLPRDPGGSTRVAQRLSVPELKVEDELVLAPPPGVAGVGFMAVGLARHGDDLVLTGRRYPRDAAGGFNTAGADTVIAALSLSRKQPVHPPLAAGSSSRFLRHSHDLSRVLLYKRPETGNADKRAPKAWVIETWDARSGKRIARLAVGAIGDEIMWGFPAAVPMSNLLIVVRGPIGSPRRTLMVVDDRSGAVVQEIGPLPSFIGLTVSPDGSRAAIFSQDETRIYRINRRH